MAEAAIAMVAVVAVNIVCSFRDRIGDRSGAALDPIEVEIFPEGRRAEREHPAPVGADRVKRFAGPSALGFRPEQTVAEEGRESTRPVSGDQVSRRPFVGKSGKRKERRRLL